MLASFEGDKMYDECLLKFRGVFLDVSQLRECLLITVLGFGSC